MRLLSVREGSRPPSPPAARSGIERGGIEHWAPRAGGRPCACSLLGRCGTRSACGPSARPRSSNSPRSLRGCARTRPAPGPLSVRWALDDLDRMGSCWGAASGGAAPLRWAVGEQDADGLVLGGGQGPERFPYDGRVEPGRMLASMGSGDRASFRRAPRQERSRSTVDAIFEAAGRLVDQAGLEGATTARIAHVAGVSIGSLYQYFPKKEALFGALTERAMERDLQRVREAVDRARDLPLEPGVREVLAAAVRGGAPILGMLHEASGGGRAAALHLGVTGLVHGGTMHRGALRVHPRRRAPRSRRLASSAHGRPGSRRGQDRVLPGNRAPREPPARSVTSTSEWSEEKT